MLNSSSLHLLDSYNFNNNLKLVELFNNNNTFTNEPFYIKELKIQIINKFLIPISNDNFDIVMENNFLISFYKDKIHQFLGIYPNKYQLDLYKYILNVVNYAVVYHITILKSRTANIKDKGFGAFKKNLGIISLKTEYFLYNEIIGSPNLKAGEKYDNNIIKDIKNLLQSLDTNFNKIKIFIEDKYK